ncbi:MAG TPA: hypothetical protein VJ813_19560, partial [Vicinamibacterales bacterium]|nr:hypothetical protein [Vicinamibacterales bacterium]
MRVIRPLYVARLAALLLGLSVCLPTGVDAQTRKTPRKAPAKSATASKKPAAKPTYSASSARARKA